MESMIVILLSDDDLVDPGKREEQATFNVNEPFFFTEQPEWLLHIFSPVDFMHECGKDAINHGIHDGPGYHLLDGIEEEQVSTGRENAMGFANDKLSLLVRQLVEE